MTGLGERHDPLVALAQRACAAAGTDLDAVLADLTGSSHDDRTPAAIRAGWDALDLIIPTSPRQERP